VNRLEEGAQKGGMKKPASVMRRVDYLYLAM
jgi:hypothetical protein